MKKMMMMAVAALALVLAACGDPEKEPTQPLVLTVDGIGTITADTTITLTKSILDPVSGRNRMEIKGTLAGPKEVEVLITRSDLGFSDEFCAAGQCTPSNGELKQTIALLLAADGANWYAHYFPSATADYTVEYVFNGGTKPLRLKVVYSYKSLI